MEIELGLDGNGEGLVLSHAVQRGPSDRLAILGRDHRLHAARTEKSPTTVMRRG